MSVTTIAKKTKPIKYLRLTIDTKTQSFIDQVKFKNPLFSDADVLYYTLGKYIVTDKGYQAKSNFRIGEILREVNQSQTELTEDQIFQILKDNDLM
jgi:hypothetical protein